jgi:hypothetical protein
LIRQLALHITSRRSRRKENPFYLRFCKGDGAWKHLRELGAADGERFLSHLAVDRQVSSSSRSQAAC